MNKWEEDMIEQLRKESEDIQIPDSLRPDKIEKRLTERPKKYHWKKGYTAGLAAACCLLVCGAVLGIQKSPQRVSPVVVTLSPTAAAISPEYTISISSLLLACIWSILPTLSFFPFVELYT